MCGDYVLLRHLSFPRHLHLDLSPKPYHGLAEVLNKADGLTVHPIKYIKFSSCQFKSVHFTRILCNEDVLWALNRFTEPEQASLVRKNYLLL